MKELIKDMIKNYITGFNSEKDDSYIYCKYIWMNFICTKRQIPKKWYYFYFNISRSATSDSLKVIFSTLLLSFSLPNYQFVNSTSFFVALLIVLTYF